MRAKLNWWPWALAAGMMAWAISSLFPRAQEGWQVREFGRLPVLQGGRVQPFDSVARNSLQRLRGKQTAPVRLHFGIWRAESRGQSMPAMEWLLEVMFKPSVADTRKVFRIDHPQLTALFDLPGADPAAGEDGKHYSFHQLQGGLRDIERMARLASEKESAQRDSFERQTLHLYGNLVLYRRLKNSIKPEEVHDLAAELEAFRASIGPGVEAARAQNAGLAFDREAYDRLVEHLRRFEMVHDLAHPMVLPPAGPEEDSDGWENFGTSVMESARTGEFHPAVEFYGTLATAYHSGATNAFNGAVREYRQWLESSHAGWVGKAGREVRFNEFAPFYRAMVVDVLAFLLVCFFWARGSENLRRGAVLLLFVGVVLQSTGLLYRMVLEGRPPVTNLYSSAVFIGWASALLGLLVERVHRLGIGVAAGSFVGFATLVIAHNLQLGGDTMEMMRAVLDSNFWLATHVVTITIGYSAMFLAGFFGMLLLVLGPFSRVLTQASIKAVGRLIYGIICFATLFSFVGTILGGIWADQSWGRFWGWDPKENGALMIVIWCAVMLHARWGGLVRDRGLAAMAVFGNIITSFSWFGTNMLGIGLHSYGFTDAGFKWLTLFAISQLVFIALALIPTRHWRSLGVMHSERMTASA
jgi:ABC-type transport system involved in cytochrome c biogenesis permease subunit